MGIKYICRAQGCNAKIGSKGYCATHAHLDVYVPGTSHRPQAYWSAWYRSARWRALRREVIGAQGGCCAVCGCTTLLEVHHRVPHRGDEELFYNRDNLMVLCKRHHNEITAIEIQRRKESRR